MPRTRLPLALALLFVPTACAGGVLTPKTFVRDEPAGYTVSLGAPPTSVAEPASTDDAGLVIEGRLTRLRSLGDDAFRTASYHRLGPEIRDGFLVFDDAEIELFDRQSGQPRWALRLPPYVTGIAAVAASEAGDRLAALRWDSKVIYYPRRDAAPEILPPPPNPRPPRTNAPRGPDAWTHDAADRRLAFSRDGRRLVAGNNVYDLDAHAYLLALESGETVLDLTPDEALVAATRTRETPAPGARRGRPDDLEGYQISRRSLDGGPRLGVPALVQSFPLSASVAERWMLVPTGEHADGALVIDLDTGAQRATTAPGPFTGRYRHAAHPEGLWRAAGDIASLLDAAGKERFRWESPSKAFDRSTHMHASPSGRRIALRSSDRYPRRDTPPTFVVNDDGTSYDAGNASDLRWLDDHRLLLSSGGAARVVDTQARERAAHLAHAGILSIDIADDGRIAVIDDRRARLITGDRATPLTPPDDYGKAAVAAIALGPRGPLVTVGDWGTRLATFAFDDQGRPATAVLGGSYLRLGRDGMLLAKIRRGDHPRYAAWSVPDFIEERALPSPHERYAHDGLIFGGGRRALIRSTVNDMNLFWVLDEGAPERRVQVPFHGTGTWATSPDGELLALADPKVIALVSLTTGKVLAELPPMPHVASLAVSRGFVAVAGERGELLIWSTKGEQVGRVSLAARHDFATALSLSPDERSLAVGTGRGRMWVLRNGAQP